MFHSTTELLVPAEWISEDAYGEVRTRNHVIWKPSA